MEFELNCTKFGLNCVAPFHLHNSIIRFYCVITVLTRVPREKKNRIAVHLLFCIKYLDCNAMI